MIMQKSVAGQSIRAPEGSKRVVLSADGETFASLCRTDKVRLRLFCREGSAIAMHLENLQNPPGGYESIQVVTLTVTKGTLLETLEKGREIVFYSRERDRAIAFRQYAVSKDSWLGAFKPLCEPRN